jgi:hypothetical protein
MVDITNYAQREIALLAGQFQDDSQGPTPTNLQKLIRSLCTQNQSIQTQLNMLQFERTLKKATGVQLDGLGQILGLARIDGQSDDSYREALEFQIFINSSSGTPEQSISALKSFTDADRIWYVDYFPAMYYLQTDGLQFPINPSDLVAAIQNLSPAGVDFEAVIATYNTVQFQFWEDPIVDPFFVNPDPLDPDLSVQLELNTTNFLYVNSGAKTLAGGGWFAEFGNPIDTTGAGQLVEALQINGNVPPPY